MNNKLNPDRTELSRRVFLRNSAAAGAAVMFAGTGSVFAAGSDRLKIGLVGCGSRGTQAVQNCVESSKGIEIIAMGDLFKDQLDRSVAKLKRTLPSGSFKVTADKTFVGFDAYKKVIATDIDIVLLVTPPHFRPIHLEEALAANKNVFMEKPVAVDAVGVRKVIEQAKIAKQKKLAIVTGTQSRHSPKYIEIMKRIHDGAIGELLSGQCYYNMGELWGRRAADNWKNKTEKGWTDMEWQCRNWLFSNWLSGDQPVEQHIHKIDAMNWGFDAVPVEVKRGMGGRETRTGPEWGNVFDHFAWEYIYPNGVRVSSFCRQMKGCTVERSIHFVGTKGTVYIGTVAEIKGQNPYTFEGDPDHNPQVQEHTDLINSIRSGRPDNDAVRVAESTLTAIMGRTTCYTGRDLSWKWAMKSKQDLSPPKYEFGPLPLAPAAVPGKTLPI